MRELKGSLKTFVAIWTAVIALFHLYTAVFGIMQPRIQRGIHLLFLLPMAFILFPATKKSPTTRPSIPDIFFAVLSLLPALYVIIMNEDLNIRMHMVDPISTLELWLGIINIVLLVEAIRRVVVPAMAILVGIFFLYIFVAPVLPGIFYSRHVSLARIVEMNYLITDSGIYGSITGVTATFVAIFVIFGSFMQYTKTGEFFTNFACKVAGRGPGGPAKIAVVSSGLFGSISGVAAANVYATGTFTIPMMKKLGYRPQFAGAVEAAASTGGLIMPPIMGAGAFVMSEITNIPYKTIALAALLGAILYYWSIGIRVHFVAVRDGLKAMDESEMLPWKQIIKDSYLLIPMVVLIYMLMKGYSPFGACTYAIASTFLLSFLRKDTRMTPKRLFEAFSLSGHNLIMLAVSCAGAGMVISIVTYTGLALGIATIITSFSHGILLPALILIMITAIILGMGLPCTPAYIIAATIGAPALMGLGVPPLSAHLFVFYFAILAAVTPPVCIAAYCGAAIAGTKPLSTGFEAARLAIMGYIIPFIFVYNNALLFKGPALGVLTVFLLLVVVTTLSAATISGFMFKRMGMIQRALTGIICAAGIWLASNQTLLSGLTVQLIIIAVSIAGLVYFSQRNKKVVQAMGMPA